jgi:hypothetical protein
LLGLVCFFLYLNALGFGFFVLLTHFHLLATLSRELADFKTPPPDDDPDGEYRDRYLAGGGADEA